MSQENLLNLIRTIQQLFPAELVQQMWFNPVNAQNLPELIARYLTVFSPVFLPIFERDGDIYTVHLQPQIPWENSAWIMLPHDGAEPILVATSLPFLPGGIITPPHFIPNRVQGIWSTLLELVARIPGGVLPEQQSFVNSDSDRIFLRGSYDLNDGAARIAQVIENLADDREILTIIETILRDLPDDPLTLAATAVARRNCNRADAAQPALQVMTREVFVGFRYVNELLMPETTGELLELMRPIAASAIDSASPLNLLKGIPLNQAQSVTLFQDVSEQFHQLGAELQALNQLRNGAAIAANNFALNQDWCQKLAQQSERVESGGLSASLAHFAAEVIHLGA